MSARPEIPAVEGVADKQVAGILGAMKLIVETITGRSPNRPQIALLGANAGLAAHTNKINEIIARLQSTDGGAAPASASGTGILTNSLTADVALNDTTKYFDGPSVPQGSTGTWLVIGVVTLSDSAQAAMLAKLWDGTKVIDSRDDTNAGLVFNTIALCGVITAPTGNLRISVKDASTTNGKINFNASGNSMDSTITAIRIA